MLEPRSSTRSPSHAQRASLRRRTLRSGPVRRNRAGGDTPFVPPLARPADRPQPGGRTACPASQSAEGDSLLLLILPAQNWSWCDWPNDRGRTHESRLDWEEIRCCAFGGTGFASRPPRRSSGQPLEEGQHVRTAFGSPLVWRTGGRLRSSHACASGARRERGSVALLVLPGQAWRDPRIDDSRVWRAWSAYVNQQFLLDVLPRQRSGTRRAPPLATRLERVHRQAGAADRSPPPLMAPRSRTRPSARPTGCANRE